METAMFQSGLVRDDDDDEVTRKIRPKLNSRKSKGGARAPVPYSYSDANGLDVLQYFDHSMMMIHNIIRMDNPIRSLPLFCFKFHGAHRRTRC